MAKVSLRIYNREIESLIDQGSTNEAIAHCHHILKTFSKHLATYRLLGKAYLELKRYNEAVDIFGRILMSVPDDFVSHVGMSIINDEENKLDDSIWHMERAFEAQPSNAAIQGELQRLYGRRDGMEPPKIRMTRGALAHMYVQGELYPQAIAEIRAVLAQDPQRADMQVLLALAYFRGGQKADASDMCAQLLKRYLYCFDANRIMVELIPSTAGAAESTQVYRMRVGELDPYATFTKGSVFQSNEVADAAVNLERLEYKEEEPQLGQAWGSSLGLGSGAGAASIPALGASSSNQPDWLKSGGFSDPTPQAPIAKPNNEIPDFLRDAGWGESNAPERPTSFFDDEPASGALTPADLPDWLKGQIPTDTAQPTTPQPEPAQSIETPDWLMDNSQDSFTPNAAQKGNVPDWLSGLETPKAPEPEPAQKGDVPDWLSGLETPQASTPEPAQEVNMSDWLSGLDDAPQASTPEPAQESNVPDWLSGLDAPQASASEPAQEAYIPDWLKAQEPVQPASSVESLGSTAQEQDDAVAWLESLAAKHGAKPEELVTDPSKRFETPPEWVSQAQNINQQTPAPQAPAASVESLGSTAQEQDDAVAWLESLAAKHGAKPEELVTDPSKRNETPPEWVSQAQNINQQVPAPQAPAASLESLGSTAQEQDDAVAWLESLAAKHGAKPEELVTDPSKRNETPPDWVSQAQNINQQAPAPQTPAASVESLGSTAQEQDDAVAWLESLAAKHGAKPEELVTDPSKRFEKPPEWVSQAQSIGEAEKANPKSEVVDNALNIGEQFFAEFESASTAAPATDETSAWLQSLDKDEEEQPPLSSASKDIPDWLRGDGEKDSTPQTAFASQSAPENDLSDWLSGLDDEPGLPFDAVPNLDSILYPSKSSEPAKSNQQESKSDLPDWLRGVDSQNAEPADEWKSSIQEEPAVSASDRTEEPVPATQAENLPGWLQSVDETETSTTDDDDTPPWLHREKWEAEEPQIPTPTSPSDWHPIESKQPEATPAPKQEVPVETYKSFVPQNVPPPQPVSYQPVAPAQPEEPAKKKKQLGLPARKPQPETVNVVVALNQAKGELDRGDIPAALAHYGKLIKKGKHLEETIRDLTESIYRYPVEVGIWQTLGDAYMRANRLKEALEAYNKAEELIR